MGNNLNEDEILSFDVTANMREHFQKWLEESKDNILTDEELDQKVEEYLRSGRDKMYKEADEKKKEEQAIIDDKFLHGELLRTSDGYVPMSLEQINDPSIPDFSYYFFSGVLHCKINSRWVKVETSIYQDIMSGLGYALKIPHIWITRPGTLLGDLAAPFSYSAGRTIGTSDMVISDMQRRKYHNRENIIGQEIKKATSVAAAVTGQAPLLGVSVAFGVDDMLSSKNDNELFYNTVNTGLSAFGFSKSDILMQNLGNFASSLTMADSNMYFLNGGYFSAFDFAQKAYKESPKVSTSVTKVPVTPAQSVKTEKSATLPPKNNSIEDILNIFNQEKEVENEIWKPVFHKSSESQINNTKFGITGSVNSPNIYINGSLINNIVFITNHIADQDTIRDLITEALTEACDFI